MGERARHRGKRMNLKEAAQQALEALEDSHQNINPERRFADELTRQIADSITALRAALEPVTTCHELSKEGDKLSLPFNHFPDAGKMVATSRKSRQVEPVAWRYIPSERLRDVVLTSDPSQARLAADYGCEVQPLYPAPPKRQPLTEKELEPIRRRMMMEAYNVADDGDSERYNALKVMANDVLDMLLGGEE